MRSAQFQAEVVGKAQACDQISEFFETLFAIYSTGFAIQQVGEIAKNFSFKKNFFHFSNHRRDFFFFQSRIVHDETFLRQRIFRKCVVMKIT